MTDETDIDYDKLADSIINQLSELGVNRRDILSVLAGGGVAAAGLANSRRVAAQNSPSGILKVDQLGTSSEPVSELYVDNQTSYNNTESFDSINTDSLNSEDLTQAKSGDVVKVGSNPPDLTTESVSGGIWNEDGNSPKTVNSSASASYTFADEYDEWRVDLVVEPTAAGSINLTLNGDTGTNYTYQSEIDDSPDSGKSSIRLGSSDTYEAKYRFFVDGRFESLCVVSGGKSGSHFAIGQSLADGLKYNISSPLTSMTVEASSGTPDWTFEVRGRDIA